MKDRVVVPPQNLRRTWDPDTLGFDTTEQVSELKGLVGQERGVAALKFGLAMRSPGYNIYVAGPPGTGKTSYSSKLVTEQAAGEPVPDDLVYVYNFDRPDEPLALRLPAGTAPDFARAVDTLVSEARGAVVKHMSTREYQGKQEDLVQRTRATIAHMLEELEGTAHSQGLAVTQGEHGLAPVPLLEGKPMTQEQFATLPREAQKEFEEKAGKLQQSLTAVGRRTAELERKLQADLREHAAREAHHAMAPVVARLKSRYQEAQPLIMAWLSRMEEELVGFSVPADDAAGRAAAEAAAAAEAQLMISGRRRADASARFRVNVFVTQQPGSRAPVVVETNPTYVNLFGKADLMTSSGGMPDDVMQIKAGAIHRANGGYLILQAIDVLQSPFAWDALKRALTTREARIEVPGQEQKLLPMPVVRPEPIGLDVKVILVGSSGLFQALHASDDGFRKQFKLKAEFEETIEASSRNVEGYAGFIAAVCRREKLRHFTAQAVVRTIEHSHRLANDQAKLSARFNDVMDIIYEANAWAAQEGSALVDTRHVKRAIQEKDGRSAIPELRLQEMIRRGTILVDVDGGVVGQVNALTVMSLGDYSFGSPSRITARVYMGQKGILHIEREIAMSGQIHDKGLFTLSAFLGDRFAQDRPLALSASIAFEQTYGPVDGDSASSTELYALLSALAEVPIDQGIAVTGSVNQRGQIQPIGGVNEKVQGFFRVCQLHGLTGRQGVMIPRRNVPNLVLSDEVVEAVEAGKFHVWAVSTIEEGIEVVTGLPAGERLPNGRYTPGSIFDRVDTHMAELAHRLQDWNRGSSTQMQ